MDKNEYMQRKAIAKVNSVTDDEVERYHTLVAEHGVDNVWTTDEVTKHFNIEGFGAPCVVVTRKSDGQRGSLYFTHSPRFYYGFEPA